MGNVLKVILLILISTASFGQVIQERNASGADRRIILKNGFRLPQVCNVTGNPDLLNYSAFDSKGAMVFDTCAGKIKRWSGSAWVAVADSGASGGGGDYVDTIYRKAGQDSIFYTINGGAERAVKDSVGGGGGGGVTTVGTFQPGSTANAASISGSNIFMHKVSATHPGMLSTGTDTIAGNKLLSDGTNVGIILFPKDVATLSGGQIRMNTIANNQYATVSMYNSAGTLTASYGYGDASVGVSGLQDKFFIGPRTATADLVFLSQAAGTVQATMDQDGRWGFGGAPLNSALIGMTSTTRGFRPPSMTVAQRNAIASPADGLMAFIAGELQISVYDFDGWSKHYGDALVTLTNNNHSANFSQSTFILPTITANRTLTLKAASQSPGKRYLIFVDNSAGFTWSTSVNLLDKDGTTFTALTNDTVYELYSDGTNYRVINKY